MTQDLTTPDATAISRFVFGTMQWGGGADEDASRATYAACRQAGINHFDTAFVYTDGASETLLGKIAAADRDQLFIASKVGYLGGASRAVIHRQFDETRRRLGFDTVDLLYLHRWDDDVALEETFQTMAKLQSNGSIRHIGVSNYAAWQVMKAQNVASRFGTRIDFVQPMLNLVKRQAEVEILPMAAAEDIEVASYSPLGGGLLTGKYARDTTQGRLATDHRYKARYGPAWMHAAAAGLAEIAAEAQVAPATLAIAWLARHAPRVRPILSARTANQLSASLDGITFDLPDPLFKKISALSQNPAPATDRLEEG